jgi:hypothetical protein
MNTTKPTKESDFHDYLLQEGDQIFFELMQEYPQLKEALESDGETIYFELRDGQRDNTHWILLPMPSESHCKALAPYLELITQKLSSIPCEVLEGFAVVYPSPLELEDDSENERKDILAEVDRGIILETGRDDFRGS